MSEGWVYILINPSLQKNLLKIGKTSASPEMRAKQLSTTGSPAEFYVAYEIKIKDIHIAERLIHSKLSQYRYTSNREFFQLPLQQAIQLVQDIAQQCGVLEEPADERLPGLSQGNSAVSFTGENKDAKGAEIFLPEKNNSPIPTDYTKRRGKRTEEHWMLVINRISEGRKNQEIARELIANHGYTPGGASSFVGSISCCINALEGRSTKKEGVVFQYAQYLKGNIEKMPESSDINSMRYVDKVFELISRKNNLNRQPSEES